MRNKYTQMLNRSFYFRIPHSAFPNCEGRATNHGFTLLEVLVAVAIIGGLLVTVITTINYHLAVAARHETITVGTSLAENLFMEIESKPEHREGRFPDPNSDYSYEVQLEETLFPDIARARINVRKDRELITIYGFVSR
ncbi:MAG: type II secretion system protein [Pseudomonadota bacterium]